jgi:hypothetical protein
MAIQTGHRYRLGWFQKPVVLKHPFKLTQTPKKMLPHDHGVEIPQITPSLGTLIGISQIRMAVRAITSKRSASMELFFRVLITAISLKCGLRCWTWF